MSTDDRHAAGGYVNPNPPGAAEEHPPPAFVYLLPNEARFLDSAVARLIPADDLGPGAREADVVVFLDRQLASVWGAHGRNYRMGPWQEGTPQQGFQSPLTPQEIYRAGIADADAHCLKQHGRIFAFLTAAVQDAVLRDMESGAADFESVSSRLFFAMLLRNVIEGFFADPMYGGNRDKIGWRLIGFPGVASADYPEHQARYNVAYRVGPVSILDIEQQRAHVDAQGYVRHRPR
jgi:gluconate 2-dehydrogenase gamma chain